MAERSATEWADAVRDAERRGELLTAFDLADRGLGEHPGDRWLAHRAVLALARAGSTGEAARRFAEYGLAEVDTEDVAALRARIVKDTALAAAGDERRRAAIRSAELYGDIHARTGGWYPAVNAATLWLLAGDTRRARELAQAALRGLGRDGEESYYAAATRAEAELVLGRPEAAREALARAVTLDDGDHGALATTRRQLRLVCGATGVEPAVLDVLAGPSVAHFCGHRIDAAAGPDGRFPPGDERRVAAVIASELDREPVGYAYGALAAGADILWAEALLEHGAEVHAVLPCAIDEFIRASVATAGDGWVRRFERCRAAATTVEFATDDARTTDDVLFRYGSELAMGLALLRARFLDADARQLAVWDGAHAGGAAGTAIDVARWRRHGRRTVAVDPSGRRREVDGLPTEPGVADASGRVVRALLFADVRGFSKLTDEQYTDFDDHVMGAFARALEASEDVCSVNTWGDALHVVLTDAVAAAACALALQDAMAAVDLGGAGLPGHLALRLGAHVGPVFPSFDAVRGAARFTGSHVSRTARIEPVTPPGAVYVTDAFAAALLLAGRDDFACDYVGHMPAAKDWGRLRMYRLRHRAQRTGLTLSPAWAAARRPSLA